ncbi:MAG TPA: PPK2 family polyphosphate kinase [Caulobacteraceae bacterium]|jgi:PPK2 family polyphosphate:nucleotide phosphotransferase|nr:PPK2 family polyphosphate kinase [Caulobacteraceae bacterium]
MDATTIIRTKRYRAEAGEPIDLSKWKARQEPVCSSRAEVDAMLAAHVKATAELQGRLYATNRFAVLVVLQGMDASGKDGAIKHVMSGVNPQGCRVTSFKQPSAEELRHDFLWRAAVALPPRGTIGLFNRSYYEEVLIARVHPKILAGEGRDPDEKPKQLWADRYRSIRHFEDHLHRNDVRIVKIFLHLSKEEQRKRFLARIDEVDRNWKLSTSDIDERAYWDDYVDAYERCIEETTTRECPWYIVPADDKESARLIVSQILLDTLDDLDLKWPESTPEHRAELLEVRKRLQAEG